MILFFNHVLLLSLPPLIFQVTNINKEVLCEKCVVSANATKSPPVQKIHAAATTASAPTGHGAGVGKVAQSPTENITRQSIRGLSSSSPTKTTTATHATQGVAERPNKTDDFDPNECAGCNEQLREGQALIALDRQYHIWCFK